MNPNDKAIQLYLDLLKKTLSFTLWPEPPAPAFQNSPVRKTLLTGFVNIFSGKKLKLVESAEVSGEDKIDGRIWPGYADTMIGMKRLDNLQYCLETVLEEKIEGDCIETGVWRGGACIFMRAVLKAHGIEDRRVFVADSFAGLPKPDETKYAADEGDKHYKHSFLAVSRDTVASNFEKYGLLDDQVFFLEGWFKDTLPGAPIDKLAILRFDGDMYESTMDALENLYPKLSPGGFCIIDDFALPNCELAVNDFREKYGITSEMVEIDWTGVYWRK